MPTSTQSSSFVLLTLLLGATSVQSADLAPIVVTASRLDTQSAPATAAVTVIERHEIERLQARDLSDLLRRIPGLSITNHGGRGQVTSVSLRGTNSDHVLVLVDGVKIGSATSGATPWAAIPLEQIERVEVVRGPRSSLYGSEAIGGVVQLFTRQATTEPFSTRLRVSAGTYHTLATSLSFSASSERAWADVDLGQERSRGFDACRPSQSGGCSVDQPDRDGFEHDQIGLRGGYRWSERLALTTHYLRAATMNEYDGSHWTGDRNHGLMQTWGARLHFQPLAHWSTRLSLARSWDESTISFADTSINHYDTERTQLDWHHQLDLTGDQVLGLGIDYQQEKIDTNPQYATEQRERVGVYGEYLTQLGAHDLHLSLRHDEDEQLGGQFTGNLGWGLVIQPALHLTLNYGTAFKAPSFNDLYYPGYGNPALKPETARAVEAGVSGAPRWGAWSLNLYQTTIDDLISHDEARQAPANIRQARIRGAELWARTRQAGWDLETTLTQLDPRSIGGEFRGNRLPRRPQQTLNVDADRKFGRFGLGATLFAAGVRFDDLANQTRLDGYQLVDLRLEYAFSKALRLQGRLDNLFNAQYETAAYYNQPGRQLMVTLRYNL